LSFASFYYVIDIDDTFEHGSSDSENDEEVSLKASAGGSDGIAG